MPARSNKGKTQHDREVRRIASDYEEKGYHVEADVRGWDQPGVIRGVRPDIKVRKGGHETIIEVETPETADSKRDLSQQKAFKNWSKGSQTKHYKRVVTED